MRVWVIMGNDYPDAVFDNEAAANTFIEINKAQDKIRFDGAYTRIYWRAYTFEMPLTRQPRRAKIMRSMQQGD